MTRFLLDANLSRRTASFLRDSYGFDVSTLSERGLSELVDEHVIELAQREQRIVVTFDLGFGRLYHQFVQGQVGVIVLRIADQTVPSVNEALRRFFADPSLSFIELGRTLVTIEDARIRVSRTRQSDIED